MEFIYLLAMSLNIWIYEYFERPSVKSFWFLHGLMAYDEDQIKKIFAYKFSENFCDVLSRDFFMEWTLFYLEFNPTKWVISSR